MSTGAARNGNSSGAESEIGPVEAEIRVVVRVAGSQVLLPFGREQPVLAGEPVHVLAEIRQLADQGCKEVTLVGQTVNSYRYADGGKTYRLSDLLALIHDVNGIEHLEQHSSEPALQPLIPVQAGRPRVVWAIFDETDQRLALEQRPPGVLLPEFDA